MHIRAFLDEFDHIAHRRALEVAAGDGQVSRDILINRFEKVDCFDQCPVAIKKLEALRMRFPEIDLVDQAKMQ